MRCLSRGRGFVNGGAWGIADELDGIAERVADVNALGAVAVGVDGKVGGSGGLGELLERFKQSGQSETAESWVNTGANKPCTETQLEQAIGPEVLDTLSKQTGLSRNELITRLCRELPDAVDKYTPQGRLPREADFSNA